MAVFWNTDFSKRVTDAFNKIAVGSRCPLCQNTKFTVADGFAVVELNDAYPTFLSSGTKGERAIPCATLVCTRCGNTFLISLLTLGFGKELEQWEDEMGFPVRRW